MQQIKKINLTVLFVLVSVFSFAQNNTNSPYTRFGYGEIADYGSGKSKSMGGTSIGIRSSTSINSANPAAYTSIDSLTFMFEFGGIGKISQFSNSEGSVNAFNANIEYLNLQFPINKWLALSAGLLPYSFVGYDFSQTDSIEQATFTGSEYVNYTQNFLGNGSINQAYLGLGAKIGKHFSVGVNSSYLFGSIVNNHNIKFNINENPLFGATYKNSSLSVRDISFRYGLQYFTELNKNAKLTVGCIFENKSKLNGEYSIGISGVDTVSLTNNGNFELPLVIGGGLSFELKNKLLIGADVLFHNWADANFFGVKDSLNNRMKLSLGGEYLPNNNSKNYLKRITYRFGGYLTNDYLGIDQNTGNYGITFGFGFPAKGNRSLLNLGVEYGKVGVASNNLIREDYWKITLNTTFIETWFFKRRFE